LPKQGNITREADQTQSLIEVLEVIMERPISLFQGGPTYHIVNNCAILLAHEINDLHLDGLVDESARTKFHTAVNIYNGSRMVLMKHRSKLPQRLRCHEIPAPNIAPTAGEPVVDLRTVPLCRSRNCQDCVAAGIPAKEVALRVSNYDESRRDQSELEKEFDMNDQSLLALLSRIISNEENTM